MIELITSFFEQVSIIYIIAGAGVGFAVGVTGVGGGSLMTPLLLMFGFSPATAIGTDLLYAAITKSNGLSQYHKQGAIDWRVMQFMALGSIPAAGLTVLLLHLFFEDTKQYQNILTVSLGIMLILTSLVLIFRGKIQSYANRLKENSPALELNNNESTNSAASKKSYTLTFITGLVLGVFVTLSSVGAGAFGTAILMMLYPHWRSLRIVGTDLAHAVPLTFIAGIGHIFLGHVDWFLLMTLLLGSLPAIYIGARVASRLPDRLLQIILAIALGVLGIKYALFN